MIDVIIFIALFFSIGTGIGMVWVFNHLVGGGVIVGDKYNGIELIFATAILCVVVIALVSFTVRKLRGPN